MIPVSITPKALLEIKKIMKAKNIPGEYCLRVGVKGAGCAGVSYLLGFDKRKSTDQSFQMEGLDVLIEKKNFIHLMGLEIDFYDESDGRGFIFGNPQSPSPDNPAES